MEDLCFPDGGFWRSRPPEFSRTYALVLTDVDGGRTFGYCRRIRPEGDAFCLPLAICIITRHRARALFSKVRTYSYMNNLLWGKMNHR